MRMTGTHMIHTENNTQEHPYMITDCEEPRTKKERGQKDKKKQEEKETARQSHEPREHRRGDGKAKVPQLFPLAKKWGERAMGRELEWRCPVWKWVSSSRTTMGSYCLGWGGTWAS